MTGSTWSHASLTEPEFRALEPLLRGALIDGADVVSGRILRRVVRFVLPSERVVFAKQHLFPFGRVRRRYALRRSPGSRERQALVEARNRGLFVPQPLAVHDRRGFLGPTLSVLVTEGVPDGRPATFLEAAAAVDRLIEARVYHPDLHGDNLRIVGDEPCFLDFQSVRFDCFGTASGRRERISMLAKFAAGLPDGDPVHADGSVLDKAIPDPADREGFRRRLAAIADHAESSRRRHRLRSSTLVIRERIGLLGTRLRNRNLDPSRLDASRFGPESRRDDPAFGPIRFAASASEEGIQRYRATGSRLLDAWSKGSEGEGFLAWERTAPWPWATQALYIHGPRRRDVS